MGKGKLVGKIVGWLAGIGAINWGLVGAFDFNLVEKILGLGTMTDIVYILVGLSGVWFVMKMFKK